MTAKKDTSEPVVALEVGDPVSTPPKNPFYSTTTWGVIFTLIAGILTRLGFDFTKDESLFKDSADVAVTVIAYGAGPLMAIIGRWKATRPLGFEAKRVTTVS